MHAGTAPASLNPRSSFAVLLALALLLASCTTGPSDVPPPGRRDASSTPGPAATAPAVTRVSRGLSRKYAQGFAETILEFYVTGRADEVEHVRRQFTVMTSCSVDIFQSTFRQKNWRRAEASSFAELKADLAVVEGLVFGRASRAGVGVVTAVRCP